MYVYYYSTAAITCPSLSPLTNGVISYSPDTSSPYDIGTMATYSCNVGFFLEGDMARACNNVGTWDGTNPSCTGYLNALEKVCSY